MLKKNNIFLVSISVFILIFSVILLIFSFVVEPQINTLPFAITLILIANIFLVAHDVKTNIIFIVFQFTFFLFLIAGPLINIFDGVDFFREFSNDTALKTLINYWISGFAMWCFKFIGLFKFESKNRKKNITCQKSFQQVKYDINKIRLISKFLFFCTSVAFTLITLETIAYRQYYSLENYYASYTSNFPTIIIKVADSYLISFALFLATMPTKKQAKLPIIVFSLMSALTILYGVRNVITLNLLFLVVYAVLRNGDNGEYWLTKRMAVSGTLALPIIMIIFQAFDEFRRSAGFNISQIGSIISNDLIKEFLISQSISSKILANSIVHYNILGGQPVPYTLGTLYTYLKQNMIVRAITGAPPYYVNSVDGAMNSGNLGARLAYQLYPTTFLTGTGMGGSFVADLYVDFSSLGVFCGTIMMCYFFKMLTKSVLKSSPFNVAFSLIAIRWIMYIPRASYFTWVMETYSIMNLVFIVGVYMLAKINLPDKFTNSKLLNFRSSK